MDYLDDIRIVLNIHKKRYTKELINDINEYLNDILFELIKEGKTKEEADDWISNNFWQYVRERV